MSFYIVIVGCGQLGSLLANQLSGDGHEVVIVDQKESSFDNLNAEFSGFRIQGDATETDILRQAHTKDAEYFFAMTREDNVNLMIAQVARVVFSVPKVIARVYDPSREHIYGEFGIRTISPVKLSATTLLEMISDKNE